MVAEIIINSNAKDLNKQFDYFVPAELENQIKIGNRVFVPFGKNGVKEGYVVCLKEKSTFATKNILRIEDNFLSDFNINLAKLMARRYFCNVSDCIKLMLPPGSSSKNISSRAKAKMADFVYLNKNKNEINSEIENGTIKNPKQIRVLNVLFQNDEIYILDLERLADSTRATVKGLEKKGYIEIRQKAIERNPLINKEVKRDTALKFTDEQQKVYDSISKDIENNVHSQNLIYGITGSGKTEIYLQLIDACLKQGKTAIMLVPEISLTPQMINRFLARFGDVVAVLHSKLMLGERYDQWQKISEGKSKILIGARSAIFAPIKDLGIIIIDEEHDSSYKSESTPRYSAKDLAKYICAQNNIPLVLGSATPDVKTFYDAKSGKINLFTLTKRANESSLPKATIVDLRKELAIGNKSMISGLLKSKIEENIKNKKQTILFLNRRGYSSFIMCRECGFTAKCKNCNISLTYHIGENKLKCHYCGFETKPLKTCPVCKSEKIKYFGIGTEKLENEIKSMFPEVATIRMDIDTVTKKNSHEEILEKFKKDNIDILIGTQMVVKGHHFPNVTLVGIIAADSSLGIEDYRASERTFQILTQVAGRAGREETAGEVIIQTYNPDNFSIECAKEQNYDMFYDAEIMLRKTLKYPPFCDILLFNIIGNNEVEVKKLAEKFYRILTRNSLEKMLLLKPLPSPISKIKNKYRWRILAKCKFSNSVIDIINKSLKECYANSNNKSSIIVDVNPNNMI
ncbi:MAG: primosomal protein N' [Lachnospiraceae bacterium]|jgi:primosomal protein N' (replication factor Y)|nr:primosomal protein N' [Lachnospiraceae bacterium]